MQALADLLNQFQEWRDKLPSSLANLPAWRTAQRRKRSMAGWSYAIMSKIFRRSR